MWSSLNVAFCRALILFCFFLVSSQSALAADGENQDTQIDESAAERALERTLVITGRLLLPKGQVEITPQLTFTRFSQSTPVLQVINNEGFVGADTTRRTTMDAALGLNVGLWGDSQLEMYAPYESAEEEQTGTVNGSTLSNNKVSSSGFGDLRIGFAHTLVSKSDRNPIVIGRITWDTASGPQRTRDILVGGSGSNELEASLSASKAQDPLVFTGTASYRIAEEKDGFKAGDAFGLSFGTLLAASPDTSLRMELDQSFVRDLKVHNSTIAGTDQVVAMLAFGASSIVDHGKFLDLTVGVGVTPESPDYTIALSYSSRFQ